LMNIMIISIIVVILINLLLVIKILRDRSKISYLLDARDEMAVAVRYIRFKNTGCKLVTKLDEMGYKQIAFYGESRMSDLMFDELKAEGIEGLVRIVKSDRKIHENVAVFPPFIKLPNCDVILYVTEDKEMERLLDKSDNKDIPRLRITKLF